VPKGVFIVSVDTELGWGCTSLRDLVRYIPRLKQTRSAISAILEMCERYQVSFTWALVGALLLNHDNTHQKRKIIPAHIPWAVNHHSGNHEVPLDDTYLWYGRDIVDTIRNCRAAQEIGCHSFFHISYNEKNCSVGAAASDLEHCRMAFEALGLAYTTFVFPFNKVGHLTLLPPHGFICYRGAELNTQSRPNFLTPFLRTFRLLYRLFAGPSAFRPTMKCRELVNIQASMLFRVPEIKSLKVWRIILNLQVRSAKQGLLKAARTGKVFHLWFHPYQFGHRTTQMLEALDEILALAFRLRSGNKLEVLTMGQLAQRIIGSDKAARENKRKSSHFFKP